jgi:hypothetical protein
MGIPNSVAANYKVKPANINRELGYRIVRGFAFERSLAE